MKFLGIVVLITTIEISGTSGREGGRGEERKERGVGRERDPDLSEA